MKRSQGHGGWGCEVRLALGLASVAVGITACVGTTDDAVIGTAAASSSSAEVGDWEATAFASERGISVKEAAFRLRQQQHVGAFAERASAELGLRFGGVWVDVHSDDRVTLGLSPMPAAHASGFAAEVDALRETRERDDDSDLRELVSAIAVETQIDDYATVPVAFSYATLEAANAWITDGIVRTNARASAPLRSGILANQNAIELDLPMHGELNAAQRALVAEAQQRFGAMIKLGSFAPGKPSLDSCSYSTYDLGPEAFCDKPLRGGILIHSPIGNCTGGFIVRGTNGKLYQMTAGHCAQAWSDDWVTQFAHDNSTHTIGNVVSPWIFSSNGDLALLNINNVQGWTPKNWVYVSQSQQTSTDEQYTITSVGSSTQGMRICISGATWGSSNCGHVSMLGVTHMGDFGITFTNLGLADYCRCPGDSGAPVFASHTGYGVHHAGDTEQSCSCGVGYYQSLKSAEIKLSVKTLTAPPSL